MILRPSDDTNDHVLRCYNPQNGDGHLCVKSRGAVRMYAGVLCFVLHYILLQYYPSLFVIDLFFGQVCYESKAAIYKQCVFFMSQSSTVRSASIIRFNIRITISHRIYSAKPTLELPTQLHPSHPPIYPPSPTSHLTSHTSTSPP